MTRVLMISNDPKILEKGSPVRARMVEYGKLFEELYIIVFSQKGKYEQLSWNTFAYATDSVTKLSYMRDTFLVADLILKKGTEGFVITAQDIFEAKVGLALSKKYSIPLHVQIHTDMYNKYFAHSLKNKIRIALSWGILKKAKAIRAASERIKKSLPKNLQEKTSVLPIFTDLEAIRKIPVVPEGDLRKKYPQFKKIILMASRITKEKDIPTGVKAFSRILKKYPDAGLVIVGSGVEEHKIKESAHVIHEPWVDHDILISYMKTSDVFLSTSLYEGYGLSMLEAHTVGLPIVATNAGIAPELTEDVAKPGCTSKVAELLKGALQGTLRNRPYNYPYPSRPIYMSAYRRDIERTLL